jgi:hypothetical protein
MSITLHSVFHRTIITFRSSELAWSLSPDVRITATMFTMSASGQL